MGQITLLPEEEELVSSLDRFAQHLRREEGKEVELRIAGGWVRDKVSLTLQASLRGTDVFMVQLLSLGSNDLDVAISSMTGFTFATHFAQWVDQSQDKKTTVACIAANPDQSKHLETATATLFNRDVDFVQLRSEEYAEGSRIPTGVVR